MSDLVKEQRELADRIHALTRFIAGPQWVNVDRAERARLVRQLSHMEQLDHVLLERIAAFPNEPSG